MSDASIPAPLLSSRFARARQLSRVMSVLFAISFLVMLSVAVAAVVFVFIPKTPSGVGFGIGLVHGVRIGFGALSRWQAVDAMVATEIMVFPILLGPVYKVAQRKHLRIVAR